MMDADFVQCGPPDECAKHGKSAMYFRKGRGAYSENGVYIIEGDSWICYSCIIETIERLKTEKT